METAKKLREFDDSIIIVFVTGYTEYVFDGYSVGALDYIVKPVVMERLMELLHRIRVKMEQELTFAFQNAEGTWRFRQQEILYFFSDKRKCTLVTQKGTYAFYAKLDDIEKTLGERFVRIHQRYLVNPVWVDYLGNDSILVGKEKLPCSRRHKEQAVKKIARAMIGEDR